MQGGTEAGRQLSSEQGGTCSVMVEVAGSGLGHLRGQETAPAVNSTAVHNDSCDLLQKIKI